MAFLALRTCLSVILTKEWIISCYKANNALSSLMANINAYQHCFLWDFFPKVHSPKITSQFCINLSYNIEINSIIVLSNSFARNELGDNWIIWIDLIFQSSVEVFLSHGIRNNDQEKVHVFFCSWRSYFCFFQLLLLLYVRSHIVVVIGINCLFEIFNLRVIV